MCAYAERHGAVQTMFSLACYLNVVTLSTSPSPTIIFPKHSLPWVRASLSRLMFDWASSGHQLCCWKNSIMRSKTAGRHADSVWP